MASFGWKRKTGEKVNKRKSQVFEQSTAEDEDPLVADGSIDWLSLQVSKKSRVISLEDSVAKAHRLTSEGALLAEAERYWEAIKKWDEALHLRPLDEKVYEMKAQAYMQLSEVFPAVSAAGKSVELAPRWWVSHQTLGRALLGLGEVNLASRSFCRAAHIAPNETELIEEDLPWVMSLKEQKRKGRSASSSVDATLGSVVLEEVDNTSSQNSVAHLRNENSGEEEEEEEEEKTLHTLPRNYVYMRR